ncbi:MAG: M28 family peptidase [Saprospiraceae bacterium]|nr:M28 family peptidase [Saprospiraceae bacterium]
MKQILLLLCLLAGNLLLAQNQPPVLSNVEVHQTGDKTITITYDLSDAEGDPCTVSFLAGAKQAAALSYSTTNATGSLGAGILPGTAKEIVWDFSNHSSLNLSSFRLMLVADDLQAIDIQALVDQVDSIRLFGDMTFLEGIRHRITGATHLQEAKDFIWFTCLDRGLETTEQSFNFGSYAAKNIIGRHIGTGANGDTYILGGHFDSVDDAPGADDNASAVAGMMEAMRILSQFPTKKSIKFIGFDLEEEGLVGSLRYVQSGIQSGENILGMIDYEMIGYYSEAPNSQTLPTGFNLLFPDAYAAVQSQDFKGNFITNVGKQGGSATLMQQFKTHASTYAPGLRTINVEAPNAWQSLTPDLGRSDHAAFWLQNIPAIMLTDGANFRNPHYHTPGDTLGTLNFSFMCNVVKGTIATLAQLAEVQHADTWWSDMDFVNGTTTPIATNKVSISPNPASGTVKVDWSLCSGKFQKISLMDSNGRTVRTLDVGQNKQVSFNVSDLPKGNYYLKMEGQNERQIEKLVVE